jgi:hypothetical protein
MAWKTGKHAEAPQGVLCYAGPEPGTVIWQEPEASPPAAETPPAEQRAPRQPTPPAREPTRA